MEEALLAALLVVALLPLSRWPLARGWAVLGAFFVASFWPSHARRPGVERVVVWMVAFGCALGVLRFCADVAAWLAT